MPQPQNEPAEIDTPYWDEVPWADLDTRHWASFPGSRQCSEVPLTPSGES
jgi:hypothetical protein